MIKNRHGKDGVLLTNGPAKMMQAFGIHDKNWNLHFLSDSPFAIDLDDRHKKNSPGNNCCSACWYQSI